MSRNCAIRSALLGCAVTVVGLIPQKATAQLDEIVVTAQRRTESLQEVPVAVTSLDAEALQRAGAADVSRLEFVAPGFTFGKSGSDARPAIRGTRTEDVSNRADPVIAVYADSIYQPRASAGLLPLVDVKRVEVLRGPQGTLFGRNTFGGAVSFFSNAPTNDLEAGVELQLGDYDHVRASGYLNLPANDRFQFRIAGLSEKRDGYVENIFLRGDDMMDEDQSFVRASLRLAPTDNVDVVVRTHWWDLGGSGSGAFGYYNAGTQRDAAGVTDLNGQLVRVNTRTGAGGTTLVTDPYKVSRNTPTTRDGEQLAASAELTWGLGGAELKLIAGYIDSELTRTNDDDFSENPASITTVGDDYHTFSAELQLSSVGESQLEWIAGLYHFDDDSNYVFLFDNPFTIVNNVPTTTPNPGIEFGSDTAVQTESLAAYGHLRFALTDRFGLRGGVRYTKDDKSVVVTSLTKTSIGAITGQGKDDFKETTWLAGVDLRLTPNNLLYATYSTGFNAGGFNANGTSFEEQTVTAIEVGSKNMLAGNTLRLNLAAYYNDFEDLLSQAFVQAGPTVIAISTNAGSAEAWGIEAEFDWAPVEAARVAGFAAYNKAKFKDYILSNPFTLGRTPGLPTNSVQLRGKPIPLNPEFSLGLSASYDFSLPGGATLTPLVQTAWKDDYYTSDLNFPASLQESYSKTDLRLIWTSSAGRWSGELFVENIEDETVLNRSVVGGQTAIFQNFAPPRTYGLKIRYAYR